MTTELVALPPPPPADVLTAWLTDRTPATVRAYAGDLLHFSRRHGCLDPQHGLDHLLSLSQGEAHGVVLAYRQSMQAAGDASDSVNRRLAALRSVVKLAYALGRVAWTLHIHNIKHERRRDVSGPNEQERKRIFRVMKAGKTPLDKRDAALVALMFGMSLRRNEVLSLDMSDIDFRKGVVMVRRKGRREQVALKIPAHASAYLAVWVSVRGGGEGPLFPRLDRPGTLTRLGGEGLARAVARLGARAGFERRLTPHMFRHAFVTAARGRGLTDRQIIAATGHETTKTLALYDDDAARDQDTAAAAVDRETGLPRLG
jgi:integrase/recombinase XerC